MYAVNRRLEYFDMPQVRRIARDAKKDNYTFASLVMGIVDTDAFRKQGLPVKAAPKINDQPTSEKLPGASAVKAAAARSGSAAVSSGSAAAPTENK